MVAVNIAAPTTERAKPSPRPKPVTRPPSPRAAPQPEPMVTVPNAPPAKWTFGDPDLRGFDISKVPPAEAPAQVASGGPPDSEVVGVAPDGSKLYAAEWQREPTDAELAFYLRSARGGNRPGTWGLIACRTAARFKVEDCKAIGESPGSGLGYAVQEAAWQFRVKPPRIDGQYQVGTWVSIRIDIRGAE
jgi:protein TonB